MESFFSTFVVTFLGFSLFKNSKLSFLFKFNISRCILLCFAWYTWRKITSPFPQVVSIFFFLYLAWTIVWHHPHRPSHIYQSTHKFQCSSHHLPKVLFDPQSTHPAPSIDTHAAAWRVVLRTRSGDHWGSTREHGDHGHSHSPIPTFDFQSQRPALSLTVDQNSLPSQDTTAAMNACTVFRIEACTAWAPWRCISQNVSGWHRTKARRTRTRSSGRQRERRDPWGQREPQDTEACAPSVTQRTNRSDATVLRSSRMHRWCLPSSSECFASFASIQVNHWHCRADRAETKRLPFSHLFF